MKASTRWSSVALVLIAIFSGVHYLAPLQPCSVIFDLALLIMGAGFLSMLRPIRFLDIPTRTRGLLVLVCGLVIAVAALTWPAPLVQSGRNKTRIDEFMPAYHVAEYHTVRVHTSPERVWNAMQRVTFSDVPIFAALMQVRIIASGRFRRIRTNDAPILQSMTSARGGFLSLAEEPNHEVVLGLAGKFWGRNGPDKVTTTQEFVDFKAPASAKAASNLLIEDLGNGWSQLSTETRGIGTDDEGRRTFVRYWRVIYPRSGAIRRMWLNAIKARAEQAGQSIPTS